MSGNNEELGRRAVACKAWRWMPGMLVSVTDQYLQRVDGGWRGEGGLFVEGDASRIRRRLHMAPEHDDWNEKEIDWPPKHRARVAGYPDDAQPDPLPVLTDSATVGCILSLVRESYNDPTAYCTARADWLCYVDRHQDGCHTYYGRHDTEAEALVVALEQAP